MESLLPPPEASAAAPDWPAEWLLPGAPPLALDVGSHRGKFLVAFAEENPDQNILGIEWQKERVARTLSKINRRGLPNAHVVRAEGFFAVSNLPDACASAIHVLFPDPWPKRRHAGRRLVNADFLGHCRRVLHPHGLLRILTDDESYATQIRRLLADCPDLRPIGEPAFPSTGFETKFAEEGKAVFRFAVTQIPSPAET